jgi:porin
VLSTKCRIRSLIAASLLCSQTSIHLQATAYAQENPNFDSTIQSANVEGIPIITGCDDIRGSCDGYSNLGCKNSFWNRDTLTGDWCGRRTALKEAGITFAGRSTHFGFGVDGGVNRPVPPPLGLGDTFKYTGRGEYDLVFDLEKFGGLPKGSLLVRAEHWYGEYGNVSLRTGAFPPAVFAAATPVTPNNPGELFLSNFVVTQPLSREFVFYAGKVDVLGGLDQDDFAGGDGTTQFLNQAFVANPAFLLGLPYSSVSAGIVLPREWGRMSAFVMDPQDRTQDFFDNLGDLFSTGIIVGSEVKVNTDFFDKKGEMHVGGMWKHHDQTDLRFDEPPPGVYPQPTVPGFPTIDDAYTIYVGGDQYLVQDADDSTRGWGVFYRGSISDANPTPIKYFLSTGLGGYSPFGKSRGDKFGLGWYYVGASNEFGPIPQAVFGPRDGTGIESFYSFQVTPWCAVSPDVQYIKPEASAIADDAFVYGIRMNATF